MTAISTRDSTDADEGFLRRLFVDSRAKMFNALAGDPLLATMMRQQFDAQSAQYRADHPDSHDLIIDADGEPVGHCWLATYPDHVQVLDIAVLESHRRRGIATTVLQSICAKADEAGRAVRLRVWPDNDEAIRLYQRLGFVIERANVYLDLARPSRPGRLAGAR